MGKLKILSLVSALLFMPLAQASIQVTTRYSPFSNFVYQLNCVSGVNESCSSKNYGILWTKYFLQSDEDRTAVKSWREIMDRYVRSIDFEENESFRVTGRREGVDLSQKLLFAAFQSLSPEDYFERLDLVATPGDKIRIEGVVKRFYPRFLKWWEKDAKKKGEDFSKASAKLLSREIIVTKLDQFESFFETDLSNGSLVHFNFFYRPDFEKEPTSGQQMENYSVSEFIDKEAPEERMDVVIHELCHFFFQRSNSDKFQKLSSEFQDQNSIEAQTSLTLINETLATVFGNAITARLLTSEKKWNDYASKPNSFYNDYYIDKAAKAILPFMEDWLAKKKTLYSPDYFRTYMSTMKVAFGDELRAPRLVLNKMFLIADGDYGDRFGNDVRRILRVSSMYQSEGNWSDSRLLRDYRKDQNINSVIIVHPKNLQQIAKNKLLPTPQAMAVEKVVRKKGEVIYAFKKSPSSLTYILVGKDAAGIRRLLSQLGEMKSGFEGTYTH